MNPEVILAVLLSLSAAFQQGMDRYEREEFAAAEESFTKVIETDSPFFEMRDLSRVYRGHCRISLGRKPEGFNDLLEVIEHGGSPATRQFAARLFVDEGGNLKAVFPETPPDDFELGDPKGWTHEDCLKKLGVALILYHMDHDAYPPNLQVLGDYLTGAQGVLTWKMAEGDAVLPFLYRPGMHLAMKPGTLLAAAPGPREGKRLILEVTGQVQWLEEAAYQELLLEQKWPAGSRDVAAPEYRKLKQRFEQELKVLSAGTARERRLARRTILDLGPAVLPLLKEQQVHPDPEIRSTLKELEVYLLRMKDLKDQDVKDESN